MSDDRSVNPPTGPSRRGLLRSALGAGAAVALAPTLSGCTSKHDATPGTSTVPLSADQSAAAAAATVETRLAALASSTARAAGTGSPALAAAATAAARAHTEHAVALREGLPVSAASARATAAGSTGPAAPAPGGPALAAAQVAAARSLQAALRPVGGDLARLMASVAASDEAFAATVRAAAR